MRNIRYHLLVDVVPITLLLSLLAVAMIGVNLWVG